MVIARPPPEQQRSSGQISARRRQHTESHRGCAQREISLLREYRTRLIADVVTGKLDVRAAAAKLPDEADELEPLDDAEALVEGDEETEDTDLDAVTEEAEA